MEIVFNSRGDFLSGHLLNSLLDMVFACGHSEHLALLHVISIYKDMPKDMLYVSFVYSSERTEGVDRVCTNVYMFNSVTANMLHNVWREMDCNLDVDRVINENDIEHV